MHMRIYKIAAINLGSTSTKIAYYENENCVFKDNIVHTARALEGFSTIWEQFEFRKQAIEAYLKEKGILISGLDAVVTRGGHTEPIVGGVYRITRKMLEQSASEKYGNHATDLGLKLAYEAGRRGGTLPTVFNAANEMAAAMFLERKISYLTIVDMIEGAMEHHCVKPSPDVAQILEAEQETYDYINSKWN